MTVAWRAAALIVVAAGIAAGCAGEPQTFARLLDDLEGEDGAEKAAAIEAFIARQGPTPIVENNSRLVFLAQDVNGVRPRVVGDFNAWADSPQPGSDASGGVMTRIDGTDWSYLIASGYTNARIEYVLLYEGEGWAETRTDPHNPRTVDTAASPHSEVRMPFWQAQPELDDDVETLEGRLVQASVTSRWLNGSRRVWFYLPADYDRQPDAVFPTVYVLDGGSYVEGMDAPAVLDRLIARKLIPPVIGVFVEPQARSEEYSRNPAWRRFMVSELVPSVDSRYRTYPAPEQRIILGSSYAAYGAVDLSVEHPSVFGLCAALAPPVQTPTLVENQAHARDAVRSVRFAVVGGVYDTMIDGARRLRTALDDASAAVTYLEVPEGHGRETFRGRMGDTIAALLTPAS